MNTEEDDEFKRIEMESGWRKRQIEQSEMCSNYGGFCKKEWVGLTDGVMCDIAIEHGFMNIDWIDFARDIEAKLKEKNT
jgi:hypothetical protein